MNPFKKARGAAPTVAVKLGAGYAAIAVANLTGDDEATRQLLERSKRIAVVGASDNPERASNRIFAYLKAHGYDVLPVTPKPGRIHGVETVPDLQAAKAHWGAPPDMVDVFRARDHCPGVAQDAVAVGAASLWLQLQLDHPDAIATANDAGLDVVADRCILVEHGRLVQGSR